MTKQEVVKRIIEIGIVPVIRATSTKLAMQAVEAVCAGGITVIEITMTVPGAVELIRGLVGKMGEDVLVGAGTVLDAVAAERCLDAGAEFLVSPGLDRETVKFANQRGKLIIAGALTPTEVINAWKSGSDLVKIFPCGTVGGAKYIKALKGPLPQIPMVPTGGVNLDTAADFICAGAAALGVGGELVSALAMKSGNFAEISENAKKYVAAVRVARQQCHA
jgi:2-dehydro-3-deoxyphosphogluconate aldolase/(4S)-4-hydroxy-2-oxoglutarate aldolase